MDYGPGATGGSAAYSGSRNLNTPAANNAFVNYFKYKPTLHYELKADYTEAQWSAMLQADLNSGHPILYSGRDPSGGHAFVISYSVSEEYRGRGLGRLLLEVAEQEAAKRAIEQVNRAIRGVKGG